MTYAVVDFSKKKKTAGGADGGGGGVSAKSPYATVGEESSGAETSNYAQMPLKEASAEEEGAVPENPSVKSAGKAGKAAKAKEGKVAGKETKKKGGCLVS